MRGIQLLGWVSVFLLVLTGTSFARPRDASKSANPRNDFLESASPEWVATEIVLRRSLQGHSTGAALSILGTSEANAARRALSQESLERAGLYLDDNDSVRRKVGDRRARNDPKVTGMKSIGGQISFEGDVDEVAGLFKMVEGASNTQIRPTTQSTKPGIQKSQGLDFHRQNKTESQDWLGFSK